RPAQHRWRDRHAERLGSLEVDHELELGGLLHRKVGRLRTFQNLIHRDGAAAEDLNEIIPVAHQAAGINKLSQRKEGRKALTGGELHDRCTGIEHHGIFEQDEGFCPWAVPDGVEDAGKIAHALHFPRLESKSQSAACLLDGLPVEMLDWIAAIPQNSDAGEAWKTLLE